MRSIDSQSSKKEDYGHRTLPFSVSASAVLVVVALLAIASAVHAQTWNGGTGNWGTASNWTPNTVPNSSSAVVEIDGKPTVTSVVNVNGVFTVGTLTVDSGDTLNLGPSPGGNLTIDTKLNNAGSILLNTPNNQTLTINNSNMANSGSITIADAPPTSNVGNALIANGNVTLSGGGTISLAGTVNDPYYSRLDFRNAPAIEVATFINQNNTIQGSGVIAVNSVFTNDAAGVVNANKSGYQLIIYPTGSNSLVNMGTMEASNGGSLVIRGDTQQNVNNAGGTFQALNASQVILDNTVVTGGTLQTSGTGTIRLQVTALDNVTNTGSVVVELGAPNLSGEGSTLYDTITNSGSISIGSTGRLYSQGATLDGSGTVSLTDNAALLQGTLTNLNNTIQGFGTINQATLTNGSAGVIDANSSGNTLIIAPSSSSTGFTNNGLTRASNGGILSITNSGPTTNNGTFLATGGGTINIASGALTNYSSTTQTLTGGTYNVEANSTLSLGGGSIVTNDANVSLSGANSTFNEINALANNQGSFAISNGRNFTTAGALSNSGTVAIGSGTTLTVSGGNTFTQSSTGTLTGAGTLSAANSTIDGTVAPGDNGPGTLHVTGNFSLLSSAHLSFELGTPVVGPNDQIDVTGNLTLAGTLDVKALAGFGPGTYDLINYTGTLNNNGLSIGMFPAGYTGTIITTVPGQVDLLVTPAVVPEQGTWALMLGGIGVLAAFHRRRTRKI
ncbi:MAG: hypothetical protein JO354_03210 [Verrucomicrobia bacterium]|nr:hypothetical protein [Verrucomicrobiota bacterium]